MDYAVNAQSNRLLAGRYRIGHLLGSGGFGAVYFATDERLHRPVAIKICSTRRLGHEEAAQAAQLFQQEALTLARLRHSGLTAIWDYFSQDDEWHLVMEYVPGDTLRELLRRTRGPLPLAEALDYANQICHVLAYLHSQHPPIVFRDLKPGNIMITPDGRVKLIDFGIARLFSPGKMADTVQFGTPGYAPPEQYGGQTEPCSDLYSLGVVLHQMLTGHNPASSPFRLPSARALNPAVPEELERLITNATAYNIDQRIGSAEEFCRSLESARALPVMTQALPVTGSLERSLQVAEPQTRTTHPVQPWTQPRRTLPQRPVEESAGRSLLVGLMLMLFLGTMVAGGYVLSQQINGPGWQTSDSNGSSLPVAASPSPDAAASARPSLVVFSAETPGRGRNLYSAPIEHSGDRLRAGRTSQITDFDVDVEAVLPAISPDGQQIAYTKVYTPTDATQQVSEIWLINVDGANEQRLLSNYALARAPAWHPDGTQIAAEVATSGSEATEHDIVILELESNRVRVLVNTSHWEGGPTWSPDGSEVAYHARVGNVRCMQLFTVDVNTRRSRQLTNLSNYQCGERSGDQWPDWSANNQIAFGRRNLAESDREQPIDRVGVWDASQLDRPRLTIYRNEGLPSDYPRWSSDGQYLLFEEQRDSGYGLSYMNPNAANERGQYSILTLDVRERNVRYADWW